MLTNYIFKIKECKENKSQIKWQNQCHLFKEQFRYFVCVCLFRQVYLQVSHWGIWMHCAHMKQNRLTAHLLSQLLVLHQCWVVLYVVILLNAPDYSKYTWPQPCSVWKSEELLCLHVCSFKHCKLWHGFIMHCSLPWFFKQNNESHKSLCILKLCSLVFIHKVNFN